MAALKEIKLPRRVFAGLVEVAYTRENNRAKIYDTTGVHPVEVAQVWYGDNGWTYGGTVAANWDDRFSSQDAAIKTAATMYAQRALTQMLNKTFNR